MPFDAEASLTLPNRCVRAKKAILRTCPRRVRRYREPHALAIVRAAEGMTLIQPAGRR